MEVVGLVICWSEGGVCRCESRVVCLRQQTLRQTLSVRAPLRQGRLDGKEMNGKLSVSVSMAPIPAAITGTSYSILRNTPTCLLLQLQLSLDALLRLTACPLPTNSRTYAALRSHNPPFHPVPQGAPNPITTTAHQRPTDSPSLFA